MKRPSSNAELPTDKRLNSLVRPMSDLMALVELSIADSDELTGKQNGTIEPRQQALLSSFAWLLARLDGKEEVSNRAGLCLKDEKQQTRWYAQHQLALLNRQSRHLPDIARATESLARRLESFRSQCIASGIHARRTLQESLVHLFELLLARSDASLRKNRGVYFTPFPLVRYIVRSIDLLLRREFDVERGLVTNRPQLRIVDPACGCGAFLLGVLEYACEAFAQMGIGDAWPDCAAESLLPSLTGIDVMPACCGVAEMLVHRSVEEATMSSGRHPAQIDWSAHCGNPLSEFTYVQELFAGRVPVILGNPPYANFGQRNRGEWILGQLEDYKRGLDEKKLNLDDDFIKFLRWAQYWIDQSGRGIVAMVTNNTYLTGLTHRQMRASLSDTFDQVYVLDLHGSSKKREIAPDGTADENVFPIQQGVAISLFVKSEQTAARRRQVVHADLWGCRDDKLKALAEADVTTTRWTACRPRSPLYFFVPRRDDNAQDYCKWPRLSEIFARYISGVQTKCDWLFVGYTFEEVEARMGRFLDGAAVGQSPEDVPRWLRSKAAHVRFDRQCIRPYMVAPLDTRWVYYEPRLLGRARYQLIRQWDSGSFALVFMRQATDREHYDHFLATDMLVSDRVFYSAHGAPFVAPLFVRDRGESHANLQPRFVKALGRRLGIPYSETEGGLPAVFCARDVFHWLYATVHSRSYRQRYHALLSIDFPRVPWPRDLPDFTRLCQLGSRLLAAQRGAISADEIAQRVPPGRKEHDLQAGGVRIEAGYPLWQNGQLAISRDFVWPDLISADVWTFRLGGYHVLDRWLKQRRQRGLSAFDLKHLTAMIHAIHSTCRIMNLIDSLPWNVPANDGEILVTGPTQR